MTQTHFGTLEKLIGRIKDLDDRLSQEKTGLQTESSTPLGEKGEVYEDITFADVLKESFQKLPPRASQWVIEDAIQKASSATKLDPNLLKAVIKMESGGNSNAISKSGAKGLMQLMDDTAKELGVRDPFDPHANVLGGARYLKQQLARFDGDLHLALAAYNAGPHNVLKYKGIPPFDETKKYVSSITALYQKMQGGENTINLTFPDQPRSNRPNLISSGPRPREIHQLD